MNRFASAALLILLLWMPSSAVSQTPASVDAVTTDSIQKPAATAPDSSKVYRSSSAKPNADSKQAKKPPAPFAWINEIPKSKQHPRLFHKTFRSPSLGIDVGYCIYLPPSYRRRQNKRFPVVYYLHGGRPGSEIKSISLVKPIDAAIRNKVVGQTIYVFANGGPVSHYNYPGRPDAQGEDVFIKELIPHIDSTYRTIADRRGRGLEGFSQGGRGTMRMSLKYASLFCSAAAGGGGYASEKRISEEDGHESASLKFAEGDNTWDLARKYVAEGLPAYNLLVFVGDKGINYENNLEYTAFLRKLGIPHTRIIVPDVEHSAVKIYETHRDPIMRFHDTNFKAAR